MKVGVIGASPFSLFNFRGELISRLVDESHNVFAFCGDIEDEGNDKIRELNVDCVRYPVDRNGTNPFKDILTLFFFLNYFYKNRFDCILFYTIKPIIWGGIAASYYDLEVEL